MKPFSYILNLIGLLCSFSVFAEDLNELNLFFPKSENIEVIAPRKIYKAEIEVFSFRKQLDLFDREIDLNKAISGWQLYLSVNEDLHSFIKEEDAIRKEYRETKESFLKEVTRLNAIYDRKMEPIKKALEAWGRQSESTQKKRETQLLQKQLVELEKLCIAEIAAEKEKRFSGFKPETETFTAQTAAENRVIEKYCLSRSSFDGTKLSLPDILHSVTKATVIINEVPQKNLIFSFEEGGENETPRLQEIAADWNCSGIETKLPEYQLSFRFDLQALLQLFSQASLATAAGTAVEFQHDEAQILGYRIGIQTVSGSELGISRTSFRNRRINLPISFTLEKDAVFLKVKQYKNETYCFLFPKNQKGSVAEHICLIFRADQIENLIQLLQINDKKKEIIKNPDFLRFDRTLPTEISNEISGFLFSESLVKKIKKDKF